MSEPNRLLLGLLNLAENCYGKQHLPYSDKHTLTSVGAVFRINPKAKVDADRLRQALTAIAGVSQEKLSVDATRQLESQLAIDMPDDSLEMLLCKRAERGKYYDRGQLCLPGGHVDPGEDEFVACAREIREETGYDVLDAKHYLNLGKLFGGLHAFYSRGKRTTMAIYVFVQYSLEDFPLVSNPGEIDDAQWITFSQLWAYELKSLKLVPLTENGTKTIIKDYTSVPHDMIDESMAADKTISLQCWTFMLPQFKGGFWGLTMSVISVILEAFVLCRPDVYDFEELIRAKFLISRQRQGYLKSANEHFTAIVNNQFELNYETIGLGIMKQRL